MKTLLKINSIVFISSLLGLTTFGLIARKEIRNQLNHEHYLQDYEVNEIDEIKINVDNRSVIIEQSITNKISIEFYLSEIDRYSLTTNNEVLSLEIKTNWFENIFYHTTFFNLSIDPALNIVKVNVPENALSKITIEVVNGTINIDELKINTLYAKSTNGTVKLTNSTFDSSELISSNGTINVKTITATSLNLRTSNGEIKGEHINANQLKANTSNGEIKFIDLTSNIIETTTSNGNINLHINGVFENYKTIVTTNNGTIKINDGKSPSGTFNIDKPNTISAITSNGSIYLYFE